MYLTVPAFYHYSPLYFLYRYILPLHIF